MKWRWAVGFALVGIAALYLNTGSVVGTLATLLAIPGRMAEVFTILGGVAGVRAWRLYRRAATARSWPTTNGIITRSSIESRKTAGAGVTNSPSKSRHYRTAIRYEYTVDGQRLEGTRIQFAERRWQLGRAEPEALVTRYAAGTPVIVHYDQKAPQQSLLDTSLAGFWRSIVLFATVCAALAVFGWIYRLAA